MFGFIKEIVKNIVWGFSMALGWIAAFALIGGLAAA